jgi:hypothetical protein
LATSYTFERASIPVLFFIDTILALASLYLFVFFSKLIHFKRIVPVDPPKEGTAPNDGGKQILVGSFLCCRLY